MNAFIQKNPMDDHQALASRVREIMVLIGGIPPIANPDVRVVVESDLPHAGLYAPKLNLIAIRSEVASGPHSQAIMAHELCHAQQGLWDGAAVTQPGYTGLARYAVCPYERQARRVEFVANLLKGKLLTTTPKKLQRAVKVADSFVGCIELYMLGIAAVAKRVDRRYQRKILEPLGFWRED